MSLPAFGNQAAYGNQRPPDPGGEFGEIVLQPPPLLPGSGGGGAQGMMQLLFTLPMMLGMGAMSFVYIGRSGGVMTYVYGALYASSMVGMLVMSLTRGAGAKKTQINDERRDYMRYLHGLRNQVRDIAARQREAARHDLPDPGDLWAFAGTDRMWERRRTDEDFGRVRLSTGSQLLAVPLRAPQTAPLEDLDPVAATSLRHFIRAYGTVPGLPVAVGLRAISRVTISGEREQVLGLARAILGHLVTFHSPGSLRIACCLSADRYRDWEWLKWLPHAVSAGRADPAGPVRLAATNLAELADLLGEQAQDRPPFARGAPLDPEKPQIVVLLDGGNANPHPTLHPVEGRAGITFIDVSGWPAAPTPTTLDLLIDDGRLGVRTAAGIRGVGAPDHLSSPAAEALARHMTSLYTGTTTPDQPVSTTFGLSDLLGIGDPRRVDPALHWRPRPARDRLRIPIGLDPAGRPVDLDLKESAESGMGPHGLVIGATGSGKSELLRTLVTGLAVTHSSETLNFALVDFKGGATFAGMGSIPHVCAVITNLAEEVTLVDRMGDALRGEIVRRQELLRAAGNYASVRDYEKARAEGVPLKPLPSLLVIIDEFSELLSSRPEFIELFVMIGRLGRSLAIHLMLASQRLEEGRLRGLDSHLSYRIGLRTFSSSESRAVLGVPDAYELPPIPGSAYLKVDTNTLIRFKSAYVSGSLPRQRLQTVAAQSSFAALPVRYTLAEVPTGPAAEPEVVEPSRPSGPEATGQTVMDAMLSRLVGRGPAAYQIWLPPLGDPSTLDQVMPGLTETANRGYCIDGFPGNGRLTVPVALVDKPFEQRRDLLWADFSGAAGHAVVVGAPQSGKSMLLRTLATSLALTHTPAEVQFFLLDFGGGGLSSLAGLPHTSGCAGRLDTEECRRIIAELVTLLADRERLFSEQRIESMVEFRRRQPPAQDGRQFGDVFLFIDGWMTLRQEYEQLEEAVNTLAARGLGYGIHVVLSANRWMEVRAALRDLIGTQFELRLGDPSDSAVDRRIAANVPAGAPGRGVTADRLHFLTALPRVDGKQSASDISAGAADLVKRIDSAWHGPGAPRVRLLPRLVPVESLPTATPGDRRVPFGINEADLGPALLDFTADPHFLALGDVECGKSGLLRLLVQGIAQRYTPQEASIFVADYRRSLLGSVEVPHLLGYYGSEPVLASAIAEIDQALRARLPGPDVTPEQLRNRSWWKGKEIFLIVDDYDLVANQSGNPVVPLTQYLAQAKDIGLHIIVARRASGASRAMFDPVLQRMRDLATPGLIMSGPRDEGALLGNVRPSTQPPGRGLLVSRRTGVSLVQVAWSAPAE
jgi:DNA segregation ATPase FtsK/SpoIIIE, S-DNA-T family